mmetsp:Transcript_1988/g.4034  ORF Transcript_1988/g.4034 Transcript_1988/m.4034 type:complete len:201 (-) Transcript_1988:247-849(-)
MASTCASPASIAVTSFLANAPVTGSGDRRSRRSPNPSCPYSFEPHVYTWPLSVTATEKVAPAAIMLIFPLSRKFTGTIELRSIRSPTPNCPCELLPKLYKFPALLTTRENPPLSSSSYIPPAATRVISFPANAVKIWGVLTSAVCPKPSCPALFLPNANSAYGLRLVFVAASSVVVEGFALVHRSEPRPIASTKAFCLNE